MSEAKLNCPTCGTEVALGTLTCPNCGVNIRTGETYDTRRKRATDRVVHHEHYQGGIYVGVVVVFGLVVLGGFLYQRRVEHAVAKRGELYMVDGTQLDEIDSLISQGRTREATDNGRLLIADLRRRASQIRIEVGPAPAGRVEATAESKAVLKAEKGMLQNLVKKVEHTLSQVSAGDSGTGG